MGEGPGKSSSSGLPTPPPPPPRAGVERRLEVLTQIKRAYDGASSTPAAGEILRVIFPAMCQVQHKGGGELGRGGGKDWGVGEGGPGEWR